jgi:hypothetical protein
VTLPQSQQSVSDLSSGQWCERHGCHQDDPAHPYEYPECERRLRDATPDEEAAVLVALTGKEQSS